MSKGKRAPRPKPERIHQRQRRPRRSGKASTAGPKPDMITAGGMRLLVRPAVAMHEGEPHVEFRFLTPGRFAMAKFRYCIDPNDKTAAVISFRNVHTDYRRKGIGTAALNYVMNHLKKSGFRAVKTQTRQAGTALFFMANGFDLHSMKERPRFAADPKAFRAELERRTGTPSCAHLNQMTFRRVF